jgi:Tol biopolymer transport system component
MLTFRTLSLTLLSLIAGGSAALAQGPSAEWRTATTPHFRIHYPAPYEAWSLLAASRLEAEREAVGRETGYLPAQTTDVVVMNPIADANGLTFALLDTPRIVLYTEPPAPESQIGDYGSWIELLTVHEMTHLVHLLRPSRNPSRKLLSHLVPLDPITLRAPRWVIEGYATVVEGRLTGYGRPGSAMRAAVLRKFAQSGRFPSYGQLNSNQTFLGMSMAYLVGSSFLEWLEQRLGPDSLRHLWARMTARQSRTFAQAFEGVFGDGAERLYGQYLAELTARSVAVVRTGAREGALWQETPRNSGDPAVSPDGKEIVAVLREHDKPPQMVIWSATDDVEADARQSQRIRKMLERDPEDVGPVSVKPASRKPRYTLVMPDGGDIDNPRWLPDGRAILYSHRRPDREGFLHHDLFLWFPQGGERTAVTHLADVAEADPLPDGQTAIAVRTRFGLSQLVRVTLATGAITAITEPSLERVYSHPRVNADGTKVAFALHERERWRLVVRDLRSGSESSFETGDRSNVATPEWSRIRRDELYASVLARGFIDLYRFSGEAIPVAVTRTAGAALMPAPAPDGRLFFMSLQREGYVLNVLPADDRAIVAVSETEGDVIRSAPPVFESGPVSRPRPYGFGRQEWTWLTGGSYGASGNTTEVGLRVGDVAGRIDTIVVGGFGSGAHGAAVASIFRGWPVALSAHAFHATNADTPRHGLELRGSWRMVWPLQTLTVDGGTLAGSKRRVFLGGSLEGRQAHGPLRSEQSLQLEGDRSSGASHGRAVLRASVRTSGLRVGVRYQRDASQRAQADGDEVAVGGIGSSLTPLSASATRVFDPALPVRSLIGARYEGRRLELGSGLFTAFLQQHRIPDEKVSLAGVEVRLHSDAMPILKAAALDLTAGIARTLQSPRHTRAWLSVRWRP